MALRPIFTELGLVLIHGAPKMTLLQPKTPILHHFRPKNGSETATGTVEKRSSARLARLLVIINDRGESHSHRARHRGG
jgi:hypothetical protein